MILCKNCGAEIKTECFECMVDEAEKAKIATEQQLEDAEALRKRLQKEAIQAIIDHLNDTDPSEPS